MLSSARALLARICHQAVSGSARQRKSKALAPLVGEVCESRRLLAAEVNLTVPSNVTYYDGDGWLNLAPAATVVRDANDPSIELTSFYINTGVLTPGDTLRFEDQGTGPGQVGFSAGTLSYEGTPIGTGSFFFNPINNRAGLEANFTVDVSDAIVQAVVRAVQFHSATPVLTAGNRSTSFFVAGTSTGSGSFNTGANLRIEVNPASPPALSNVGPRVTYVENAAPLFVWDQITLTDSDSRGAFGDGRFVVRLAGAGGADRLSIASETPGSTAVTVSGNQISYGGTAMASFTGGLGSTPLDINFNGSATVTGAQEILRQVTFDNPSDNPTTNNRTVSVQVRDSAQRPTYAAKSLRVIAVNDNPTLFGLGPSPTYVEGGSPVIVAPDAGFTDPDSANFDGGQLTVKIIANISLDHRLTIRNEGTGTGQVGVNGSTISFAGVTVGTFTGGQGTTPLVITWNANALPRIARQVVRNVQFHNVSATPTPGDVTVQFIGTDGDGGRTDRVDQVVHLTPVYSPTAIVNTSDLTYITGTTAPVRLAPNAGVSDPDGAAFSGATLAIGFSQNGTSDDLLSIRNGGAAAGQIGLSGSNITYGGVTIGALTGDGSTVSGLLVTFNSSATLASLGALVRAIQYRSLTATPNTAPRVVTLAFTDGEAVASTPVNVGINFAV